MSEIINYKEQNYKRTIDYSANFLLIGNKIDGFVDIDEIQFKNFEELKLKLPSILSKIECFGEWQINLYQISKPYRIRKKYGYFKVPTRGKLVFEHSYMNYPINSVYFLEDKIQIVCSLLEIKENWNAKSNEDFLNHEIDIEIINIYTK